MQAAREEMNLLLVEFANKQVNLAKVELISVPLTNGVATYSVPARVVMMLDVYITRNPGTQQATDQVISPLSRTEYASLASKQITGQPTQFWFSRTPPAQTFTLYPVPDNTVPYTLNYYACSQMQDANLAGGETPDIPYRWYDAFVAGMAYRLSRIYAPELEDKRKADAMESWTVAATQDVENVSLSIAPQLKGYFSR
jgi:hypothetical protein